MKLEIVTKQMTYGGKLCSKLKIKNQLHILSSLHAKLLNKWIYFPVLEQFHHLHIFFILSQDVLNAGSHHQQASVLLDTSWNSNLLGDTCEESSQVLVSLFEHLLLSRLGQIKSIWIEEKSSFEGGELGNVQLQLAEWNHDLIHLPGVDWSASRELNLLLWLSHDESSILENNLVWSVVRRVEHSVEEVEGEGEIPHKSELIEKVQPLVNIKCLCPLNANSHLANVPHADVVHRRRIELLEDGAGQTHVYFKVCGLKK